LARNKLYYLIAYLNYYVLDTLAPASRGRRVFCDRTLFIGRQFLSSDRMVRKKGVGLDVIIEFLVLFNQLCRVPIARS